MAGSQITSVSQHWHSLAAFRAVGSAPISPTSIASGEADRVGEPPRAARRRILALCLGGIGDTVLAFAALRDLRRACPEDHLTALAMWPQSAELLSDLGLFDEVLQHNFQKDRLRRSLTMALQLRRRHYDVSLLPFPTNRFEYNALSRLIGAPRRFGHTYIRGGDFANMRFLLTDRIAQQLGRHTVDENRALVAAFTGKHFTEPADIHLGPLGPLYHAYASHMLRHLRRPLVGVHPGCSIYKGHEARRWPAERFGELCQRMYSELRVQPVVFGLPDEWNLKLTIQAICPEVFLAHGPTIRHTAALISRCAAFVSNDSALAHIACAVDVPVTMVCGPTLTSSIRPYPDTGRVVSAHLPCSPCFLVGRRPLHCTNPVHLACLKAVQVSSVVEAVERGLTTSLRASAADDGRSTIPRTHRLPVLEPAA